LKTKNYKNVAKTVNTENNAKVNLFLMSEVTRDFENKLVDPSGPQVNQ
jgi:hypothetical protein